jgi:hypothetical protein
MRLAVLGAGLLSCSSEPWPEPRGVARTQLVGRAPWSAGGQLQVRPWPSGAALASASVDADGGFAVDLEDAGGDLLLEARGGSYIEPVGGRRVDLGDQVLQAVVRQVEPFSRRTLAITPWTHLSAQAAATDGEGFEAALLHAQTCGHPELQGLMHVDPLGERAAQGDTLSTSSSTTAALATAYLGGLSQLAAQSQRTSLELLRRWVATPPWRDSSFGDLLRQPLAQATRRFVSAAPELGLQPAVLDPLLSCLAEDRATALGKAGSPLDREPPQLELRPARPGAQVSGRRRFTCRACDASGVAQLRAYLVCPQPNSAKACDLPDPIEQQVEYRFPCATLKGLVDAADLPPGPLNVRCQASDPWGQTDEVSWCIYRSSKC